MKKPCLAKHVFYSIFIVIIVLLSNCKTDAEDDIQNRVMVCLGDSLTSGYGATVPKKDDKTKSYPSFLQNKVDMTVINAGVTADSTADALARLEKDVISQSPDIVIIELGANDIFEKVPIPDTKTKLEKIITKIGTEHCKIYVAKFYTEDVARAMLERVGIFEKGRQNAIILLYDFMFNELSEDYDIEIIDNIWEGVWGEHMSDTIHPDARGYEIMADNYFNSIEDYLLQNGLVK